MRPATVFTIVVASLLPGCVGTSAPTADAATSASGHGWLLVQVLSLELQPIADARVQAPGAIELRTGPDGEARLEVPVGSQLVSVSADGFRNASRAYDVTEASVTSARFLLESIPADEPYVETRIFEGYSLCDFNAAFVAFSYYEVTGTENVPYCDASRTKFHLTVEASWRYIVAEQQWKTADSMHMVVDDDLTCVGATNPCWTWQTGRPILRAEFAPADAALAKRYATDAKASPPEGAFTLGIQATSAGYFREELNHTTPVTPFGLGMSTGNRFQTFASVFHFGRPDEPAAVSAVPDS